MTIASSSSSSTFYPVFVANTGSQAEFINTTNLQVIPSSGQLTVGAISVVGNILPTLDNSSNLGSTTNRFANVYTGDLQLSNEGSQGNDIDHTTGSWTIQEGHHNLYLINQKTGKKYMFVLKEV